MLLKYFYDQQLAHASYMVGCQRTGEAIIIDPARNIDPYIEMAEREGMRLIGAADTHIHADYVSGMREMADRLDITMYVSDEGPEDWKYFFAPHYKHVLLKDGDSFTVGNIRFDVMHTPGHTPEHLSYLLTDMGGGADRPMGIFTGDFVFVGSIGRPDLLEKAAGVKGAALEGAKQMFASVQRFMDLPDYLQLWPGHGAGSACGKGLGAIPSSTVGYEKMFNAALSYTDEEKFITAVLDGQPEPPKYFAVMKHVNREGPAVLGDQPPPAKLGKDTLLSLIEAGQLVIDTRATTAFAEGHVPGTINIPSSSLAAWAGWIVDYEKPVYLLTDGRRIEEECRVLAEIGIDEVAGYAELSDLAGLNSERYENKDSRALAEAIINNEVTLIDVRRQDEWDEGRLPNAHHHMLGYLMDTVDQVGNGKPVVLQCRSGVRSAIAASILQANGIKNVINLAGGYLGWNAAGLPRAE